MRFGQKTISGSLSCMARGSAVLGLAALALGGCAPAVEAPETPESSETVEARPDAAALLDKYEESLAIAQQTQGSGAPALWSMSDEDTKIYLFGTVHLLRPNVSWRTQAFEEALLSADTIVLEVDMKSPEGQQAITTDFNQRGMYEDGRTLRSVLSDQDEALIETALSSVGVPLDAFNAFEPWMVAISLSSMKLLAEGYDLNSGVESVIETITAGTDKNYMFLEEVSDQADAFDLLPEDVQISYLYETAVLLDASAGMLDQLVAEWADGDVAGLGALVSSPDALGGGEEVYNSLLVNRNLKWLPKIEAMLETPGVFFIAVGSGHLAGPDSLVVSLREKGYEVTGP